MYVVPFVNFNSQPGSASFHAIVESKNTLGVFVATYSAVLYPVPGDTRL